MCIDIQPYTTVQVHEREDVLHVGGFSTGPTAFAVNIAGAVLGRRFDQRRA